MRKIQLQNKTLKFFLLTLLLSFFSLQVAQAQCATGTTWTSHTPISPTSSTLDYNWKSITYGNNLFVAVADSGRVITSPDGTTWTSRTSAVNNNWLSVTYGNGLFVVLASSSNNRVMTSPDGINWTSRTSAANNVWVSITYGNGLFVAVAQSGTGNRVMTSPDGITWTSRTSAADNSWRSVTYGNGLFVAVANSGTGNRVMTSPDGITWTSRTSAADNAWNSITYGNGLFIAVAISGTGNRVMTSTDGITWTSRTSAADNNSWNSITYGNGLFVAVAASGSDNRIMTSQSITNWIGATSNSWNVASNWSCGVVPNGSNYNFTTISSGSPILDVNLSLQSGKSLLLSGTGTLTIAAGNTLSIVSGGIVDFGGKLVTLKSDATGTASIGTIAGTLSNATNVTVERFIPKRRAFRFLSSPVNTSNFISNNWQQATHITGSTTAQNGFDQSNSGTASLFTYNSGTEAWAAISNTNATNLTIGTGYRMLVRGNRTINLNTSAQDSAALILSATGSIVTGNVVFGAGSVSSSPAGIPALNAAAGSGANNSTVGWSLIGNPYACAVNWANVTKSNVSTTFATWNVNNAGRGSYVYHDGSSGTGSGNSNIINSGQAVFVQTTAANPSITFTEASKVTSTPPSHFKKSLPDVLNIDIFIGDRAYDGLTVLFDANNSNAYDVNDFIKLVNPEINFYSYLADGTKLAMNNMKEIKEETVVPLGLNGVFNGGTYELKFSNQNSFANAEVKLKDKFINKVYDLKSINNLTFTVTADSNSFGENRFELIFSQSATGLNNELSSNNNFMVFPNPANNVLNLSLTNTQEDNYSFSIFNQLGAEVNAGNLDFNAKRTHALNIENLSNGVYFIQVKNGKSAQTIKFIK